MMCVLVTPFGVIAAIYLREYARQGPVVRGVRISVNNLAGVPSIVFGLFGLGFFVLTIGGGIDEAPQAYKRIQDVIARQDDLVNVIASFQPRVVRMDTGSEDI